MKNKNKSTEACDIGEMYKKVILYEKLRAQELYSNCQQQKKVK